MSDERLDNSHANMIINPLNAIVSLIPEDESTLQILSRYCKSQWCLRI